MIIYVVENLVNGKKYVGKTGSSLEKRFREHLSLTKKGFNYLIHKALRKYGKDNFRVYEIDSALNETDLNEKEKYWIKELKTFGESGYNLTEGGEGILGKVFSVESKTKMSQSHKGVKLLENHRKAIGDGHKGIRCSEDKKRKISESMKGMKRGPMPEEHKLKISQKLKNKVFSNDTKEKISLAKTGRKRIYREDGTFYMSPKGI